MTKQPTRRYAYQNHHMDSTRWDKFAPRPDDIVIATSYKSGTTWMQTIVANLIFEGGAIPGQVTAMSPWLDMRLFPIDDVISLLDAQDHRRFIKTHLPLDALPYSPQLKYVMVGRDPRDVAMSMLNHHNNFTDEIRAMFEPFTEREEDKLPGPFSSAQEFWRAHISKGTVEWETDGWPYWSSLRYAQSWWDYRETPNILLVHYTDMLADLEGEIRRVAAFLGIERSDAEFARIADATTFSSMKDRASDIVAMADMIWKGGAKTFINKGTNGRWREHFDATDLALYEEAARRTLSAECRVWLEHGRLIGAGRAAA